MGKKNSLNRLILRKRGTKSVKYHWEKKVRSLGRTGSITDSYKCAQDLGRNNTSTFEEDRHEKGKRIRIG